MNRSRLAPPSTFSLFTRVFPGAVLILTLGSGMIQASDFARDSSRSSTSAPVVREYTLQDRIRYQLWDYTWKPDPDQPITRIRINLGQQRVYVYQGDRLAAESPVSTGKPGYDTPVGHFTILNKDIDHKSTKYGVFLDPASGSVVNGNASVDQKPPEHSVYDAADMPYYLRLTDDGVGMHAGFLPGYAESHGCIHLPQAFAELLYSNVSEGTPVDIIP